MGSDTVNRELQPSHVLSVRLSSKELRRLQETISNFQIQGSFSEQLRFILSDSHRRSISVRRLREAAEKDEQGERQSRERRKRWMRRNREPVAQMVEDPEDGDLPCMREDWSETNDKYEW